MYEHRCLENIKRLYISTGKYDYQHKYKAILEAEMVYTSERFTDNIPMLLGTSVIFKNPITRKQLCIFTEVLDVKNKTAVHRVSASKSSASQSEKEICCSQVFQRVKDKKN